MQKYSREEGWEIWEKFWKEMQEEFFKVEARQHYLAEDKDIPGLKSWMKGNREKAMKELRAYAQVAADKSEFSRKCRSKHNAGVDLIRVHVVEEPLHPYLEFEIELYKHINTPINKETVYVVHASDISEMVEEVNDFMMFDGLRVTEGFYTEGGYLKELTIYDKSDNISVFKAQKRELLKCGREITGLQESST